MGNSITVETPKVTIGQLEEFETSSETRRGNVLDLVVVVSPQAGIRYLSPP
jgi:hypothetical protein